MQWLEVDGARLEWTRFTAPPPTVGAARAPLVFLHEGLGSIALWRDWPARLCAATGRAGWAYSRRGYGRSSPIADVRDEGRHAPDHLHRQALEVLPQVLARLGVEQPVLVGHSDGATIALLYAAHHPVTAGVVMAPHLMVENVTTRSIRQACLAYQEGELRQRLARWHDDVDSAFWQWADIWLDPAFQGFDIRAECAAITAPLLAIQGVDDEYATLAQIDAVSAAVPHAKRLELAACGHSPHRDQAEAVTTAIVRFLAGLP
ncbi:MAG TPA: alpha/beta fold hydrolase [Ottowia sp.]|uniref:alpha/beta fold hydrolase n=1 Tax=Ottowia sp. TaxID=1898956 RepID=UPI002BB154DF|nr:alpha/beta fold hydrolase [Ottowia sp.]HMN20803.1 alpha/beta fold hydrolase [Ottowia sp.]